MVGVLCARRRKCLNNMVRGVVTNVNMVAGRLNNGDTTQIEQHSTKSSRW